jgi:hypothetical protein
MEPTNNNLALVMHVVATMVAGHADAPPLCGGHFRFDAVYSTGRPVEFHPRADLQIASVAPAAMVRDAALWAERLDTLVRFDRFSGYVRMEVVTEVGGVRVEVWTNISPEGAAGPGSPHQPLLIKGVNDQCPAPP